MNERNLITNDIDSNKDNNNSLYSELLNEEKNTNIERDINRNRFGRGKLRSKFEKDKNNTTTLKRKNEISQISGNNEYEIGKDKGEYYFNNIETIENKIREKESRINRNIKFKLNLKNIQKYKDNINIETEDYNGSQFETSRNVESIERQNENNILNVDYNFNICEVICSILFRCCQSRKLKIKNNLNEKANSILYNKLDIVLYVRNMILFDILNETFFGNDAIDIINFLSRPIISLKCEENDKFLSFYHRYKTNDFDKFYGEIVTLSQKPNKRKEETELISITNKHLKMLLA
jgi:hypothetical protein